MYFILGAFIGKILGLVVQYLPEILLDENEERDPRELLTKIFRKPHCSNCNRSFTWIENLPIIGFFYVRGKCPQCQKQLSVRTLSVEITVSLLFGISTLLFPINFSLLFVISISSLMVCCFMTDFDHFILPDQFTLTMVWIGLIASLFPVFLTPSEAIIGAVGGYGIFWIFNALFHYFRGFDGMFPGDFKLNAAIGACLGLQWLAIILIASTLLLLIVTMTQLILRKEKSKEGFLHKEAPYGCYSSVVTVLALFISLMN